MLSIKKIKRVITVPQGYQGPDEGASLNADDTGSVISDTADYPDEHSEIEYVSDYEIESKSVSDTDGETDNENEVLEYKNLQNVLTEEDDFAEIKF